MAPETPQIRVTSRMKLLATAAHLFYTHGINATGIDTVIAQAGVAKGSMYHHFPSKEALIAAYLDEEADAWLDRVTELDDVSAPRADRIELLFLAIADQVDNGTFYGCPFTNAAIECPTMADVQASITRYRRVLRAHLAEIVGADSMDALVSRLIVLYDGALTTAKLTRDSAQVRDIAQFAREVSAA
ncbi:TetR/AcrR family transcriptional regulator [Salinibacterium sp. SWN1162]|uniref:TetR/AcrR family transcriptional regulator n=1 Tax=Salinibacterium sp. SWN1162 TaxID=2792053 RepID=UPI0018CD2170|nr:TetR/AcrR family transcriptional regulator [Salinibacterium sp. SWN1162]MBH0009504.1 TetR/AcrR family transcriptional regulator [Salinibacterium sp. SWN1162]